MRSSASVLVLLVLLSAWALPTRAAPPRGAESYRLKADRLSGSASSDEDTYTAINVTIEHGTTTVIGDSARVFRKRELVLLMGDVRVVDGDTRMWGEEASYDRRARLAILHGNVRIRQGAVRITGQEARFFRDQDRSVIMGSPRLDDSTHTVTAQLIEFDRAHDIVTASGNVTAIDHAESTTVHAGNIRYDRRQDYAWATQSPVLTIDESGGPTTRIQGNTLEFNNAQRQVFAVGNVRVDRDKLRAVGSRGEFYENENRALLLGKPKAWDEEGSVEGDTLEIRFAQRHVQSVQVRPHAVVDYEARVERGRGERNHAVGDTATLYLAQDEARQAVIVGNAKSTYWPSSADSAQGGRNVSSGDSIIVEFDQGKPKRATVIGRSQGVYEMAAEGDTSRANQEERVKYVGDRIVYDVDRNTVDVLGTAQVNYKELTLNADRVQFNTKTEHMRAEGSPVLQDGHDRIVGNTMTYDLSIRRGTIYSGRTTYEQGFYYGQAIRKVSDDVLDVKNGSYTTCDLDEPHYHFGSNKMKIILRDKVIAEPIVFYVKHIPVLALPFYVFPIKPGRHSGFQLPQVEFGSSSAGGKFIRNLGYYWAMNDYVDGTGWFDYYQETRWIAHAQTRYQKRYHWQGEINSSFEHALVSGADRWDLFGRHYQTLGTNFSLTAQGNFTNSSQYLKDQQIGRSVLLRVQRLLDSNLSLQKGWSGAALNVGLLRHQDLDPDPGAIRVREQLPNISFSLSPRPIGHPARGKEPARWPWLASTVFSFRSRFLSERDHFFQARPETTFALDSLGAPDTTVQLRDVDNARVGALHEASLTDTRTLFGFLRVSPAMSYSEVFYSEDAAGNKNQRAGVWRGSIGANTAVFGNFRPSLGPLRAIRHVVTPSIAYVYQPSYPKLYYQTSTGALAPRFTGLSDIGLAGFEQRALTFSLRNDFHVKWGDPAQPKVLNNLVQLATSGSYNFLAKRTGQKPLSDLSSTVRLHPVERSSIDMSFVHNPYDGKLLAFGVSSGLFFQGVRRATEQQENVQQLEPGAQAVIAPAGWTPAGLTPQGLPWALAFSMSYGGSSQRLPGGGYSRWSASTRANTSVGLNPTTNWRVDYSAQFDFRSRQMISQNYSIKRDLHCWEAQFTRSISGGITEYYFKINVKNLPEVYYEQGSRGLRGFGGIQNAF